MNEAIKTAEQISSLSKIAVSIAKEAVNTGTHDSSNEPTISVSIAATLTVVKIVKLSFIFLEAS